LLPLLGASPNSFPERTLYWRRSGSKGPIALRHENWKLLTRNAPDQEPELYNLAADIGESINMASAKPDVVARLQEKLDAWESKLVTPLWGPGSSGFVEAKKKRR
jgi:arylsulfatase A-like enzyme